MKKYEKPVHNQSMIRVGNGKKWINLHKYTFELSDKLRNDKYLCNLLSTNYDIPILTKLNHVIDSTCSINWKIKIII